ncbi:hypothetical protein CDL12_15188 [Handroanthus impetiginosus]|uniref:TF-B3 domain-containing protein n=1 Tax=Handroanthus impetiginosus TaxID=429701 RepID=A0A2G9H3W9_9LAMI|nr:hypothetical protein CDL12_15188 [Handroanthus impetiginosus]
MKKVYFYHFIRPKDQEDNLIECDAPMGPPYHRILIEIRDVHPPPMLNPVDPWKIKKTLSQDEIETGKIVVSFNDAFEYIFRYWNFWMAKHVVLLRHRVSVVLWDVTYARNPKKHQGNGIYFQIALGDDFGLTCMELMRESNWKEGDYIGLYWDPVKSHVCVKVFVEGLN